VRALLLVLVALGALIGLAPTASAHAELLGTTPSNGEHLATAPTEIVLRFSENVSPVRDGFAVLDGRGKKAVDAQAELVDGTRVRLPVTGLDNGVYSVTWRVVSADSHPVHGAFVFSVGTAQAAPLAGSGAEAGADPWVGAAFWLLRWLGFAAVALLVGGLFFVVTCWPAGWEDPRLRRTMRIAWWTAVGTTVGVFLVQGANAAGSSLLSVFDPGRLLDTLGTNFGLLVLARLVLLVVGAFVGTRVIPAKLIGVALVGIALVVTWSASGHAVAGDLVPFALAMDVAHLAAMSVWLGGLAVLVMCVLWRGSADTAVIARFSRIALVAVAVLAGTGVLMALREVGLSGLLSGSRYVTLVVFKAGAFGLVLWLAAMSRASVQRRVSTRKERADAIVRLRRSVWSEAGIAMVVLGLTAVLVATPPTELFSNQAEAAVPTGPFLSALALPGGDVQVWVSPARPGDNEVVLNVRDERGVNRDVPEVTAQLALPAAGVGPVPVPLVRTGVGQYVATRFAVPNPGIWRLSVRVRITDLDAATVDADVLVS
jgi:copper transport protein